ncbi:MAG TPA: hypothetical protein VGP90_00735, partial [Acidimicrobiia bacterium]|nr:hypothetical protein [Acidimicrobiia bacterium]
MTLLDTPVSGPATPAGPAGSPTGRQAAAIPVARRPLRAARRHRDSGGGGRVVAVAAVAGAALAAGLVWAVAPGGDGGSAVVRITAHHSRFDPDRVSVKPNSTVRFVVHNSDPIDHEFIIGPPEVHDLHEKGIPHVHTGVVPGEITVPAGTTVETTWTFG